MALKQRLDMRQGQSLVMTPQLQQAIKLLQFTSIELADFIDGELERNPLLTTDDGDGDTDSAEREDDRAPTEDAFAEAEGQLDAPAEDAYAADNPSDRVEPTQEAASAAGTGATTDWSQAGSGKGGGDSDFDAAAERARELSLREHLQLQANRAGFNTTERVIAERLIDQTDDGGYLRADLDDEARLLGVSLEEMTAVLKRCQGFEPTGVMARTIGECLALQLAERDRLDPAMKSLLDHLDLVAKWDIRGLVQACGVDKGDVEDMIAEIRALTPRPGAAFAGEAALAIQPDVTVKHLPDGTYSVELNADALPKVLIDRTYAAIVDNSRTSEKDKTFLTECAADAAWLVKSLDQRAKTILKVAREIVRQQDGFFQKGAAGMRPLNLKTVADAIDMHESTVSRATANKYMATPRGLVEMKFFFSAAIPASSGGEGYSAEAVRHRIKTLIEDEALEAVLSDDQIVERLREQGVAIARRTVAKYREALRIPPSAERRRMLARRA